MEEGERGGGVGGMVGESGGEKGGVGRTSLDKVKGGGRRMKGRKRQNGEVGGGGR